MGRSIQNKCASMNGPVMPFAFCRRHRSTAGACRPRVWRDTMAAACMWLLGLALLLGSPGARADDTCTAIHTGLRLNTTLENARLNAVFSLEKSNGADSVCNVDGEYKRNCRINNVEDPAVLAYKAACEDLLGELYWYDWHFRCSLSESVLWMIASYPECVPVGATCPQEIADIVFRQVWRSARQRMR
eukprot:scaffold1397_cov254-Pinguiococcus_pyrenoidosus.AAC.51